MERPDIAQYHLRVPRSLMRAVDIATGKKIAADGKAYSRNDLIKEALEDLTAKYGVIREQIPEEIDGPKRYVTAHELSRTLSVSRAYLAELRRKGEGPPYLKAGRLVRYDMQQVEEWLASGKEKAIA